MSYQAKTFLVNLTCKELGPCKISHIGRCAFNLPQGEAGQANPHQILVDWFLCNKSSLEIS